MEAPPITNYREFVSWYIKSHKGSCIQEAAEQWNIHKERLGIEPASKSRQPSKLYNLGAPEPKGLEYVHFRSYFSQKYRHDHGNKAPSKDQISMGWEDYKRRNGIVTQKEKAALASASRRAPSPKRAASPVRAASPSRRAASPSRRAASPSRRASSPNQGRVVGGGLRYGQMERDALLSHRAGSSIRERLMNGTNLTLNP